MIRVTIECDSCHYAEREMEIKAGEAVVLPPNFSRMLIMGQEFHYCADCREMASRIIHDFNIRQKAKATK